MVFNEFQRALINFHPIKRKILGIREIVRVLKEKYNLRKISRKK